MVDPGWPAVGEGGPVVGGMTGAPADSPEGKRQGSDGEGIEPEITVQLSFMIDKPTCLKRQHCSCTLS